MKGIIGRISFTEIINTTTVVFYIVFSIIKRFSKVEYLMIIPFALFLSNVMILLEFGFKRFIRKQKDLSFSKGWLIFQILTNLGFVIYILYFYLINH